MSFHRMSHWSMAALVLGSAAMIGGCKPEENKRPRTQRTEGVITMVDPATRRMALKVQHSPKPGQTSEQSIEGTVTETTEIWINGRAGHISDLRVNDQVEATGYTQGKGDHQNYVAQSIRVSRPDEAPTAEHSAAHHAANPDPSPPATQTSNEVAHHAGGDNGTPATPAHSMTPADTTAANPPPNGEPPLDEKQKKLRMLLDEFRKQRREAVAKRDALLKEGRPADDPEVRKLENIIRKADEYIPYVEDIGAQKGVALPPEPPATQPAGGQTGS